MPHVQFVLSGALLGFLEAAAGCASRQMTTEYPPSSAASPCASRATPAALTRAFHDELTESAAPAEAPSQSTAQPQEGHRHDHHH